MDDLAHVPYSGYNLRGTIFANHQISHLAVIFGIVKFANHCMYCITFCVCYLNIIYHVATRVHACKNEVTYN